MSAAPRLQLPRLDLHQEQHLGRQRSCLEKTTEGRGPWSKWEQTWEVWCRWLKSSSRCLGEGRGGGSITVLRFLQGLSISKVCSNILQPFHQLHIWTFVSLGITALFQPWAFSDDWAGSCCWLLSACHSSSLTSRVSCTFLVQISWQGSSLVLQMSLIKLIETGPWDPVAMSDKPPCLKKHCPVTWCTLLTNVLWAQFIKD